MKKTIYTLFAILGFANFTMTQVNLKSQDKIKYCKSDNALQNISNNLNIV